MAMAMQVISKSQFKAQLLEYLRKVEKEKQPLLISHGGKPVIKVSVYKEDPEEILRSLRGSVVFYKEPTQPVGEEDWEALK